MRQPLLLALLLLGVCVVRSEAQKKAKKDVRDFTDRDFDRLYDEWEEHDEDELEEDELPPHKRKPPTPDFDKVLKEAGGSPESLMKLSKKGQSVMMFVGMGDVDGKPATKDYTEKWTSIWQSSLFNNHIDVQRFVVEDNRVIFMFSDGSKAWEAKDFLLQQKEVREVTLEGRTYDGPAAKQSSEKVEL